MFLVRRMPPTRQPQAPTAGGALGVFAAISGNLAIVKGAPACPAFINTTPPLIPRAEGVVNDCGAGLGILSVPVNEVFARSRPFSIFSKFVARSYVDLSVMCGFGIGPAGVVGGKYLIGSGQGGSFSARFILNVFGRYFLWGDDAQNDSGVAVDTDGKVHSICWVSDGQTASMYRDGVLRYSAALSAFGPTSQTGLFTIGGSHVAGTTGAGQLRIVDAMFSRALTAGEVASLDSNPCQIFAPTVRFATAIAGTISRPGSDIAVTGWTSTAASIAGAINEAAFDDASYIDSPALGTGEPAITTLDLPLAAGTYSVSLRGLYTAVSGQVRIALLDGSNAVVGVSDWQALTGSVMPYALPITTTGTATRVQIEVRA